MSKSIQPVDLSPASAKQLLGNELGTQFDFTERMFGYFGQGEVFDYSTLHGQNAI